MERDFEPRAHHRKAVIAFGKLVDGLWNHPWTSPWSWPSHSIGEAEVFEMMIQADEVIEQLEEEGLHVIMGSYTTLHERIRFGEEGPYTRSGAPKDASDGKLLICLTDGIDDIMRRTPTDHIDVLGSVNPEEIPF